MCNGKVEGRFAAKRGNRLLRSGIGGAGSYVRLFAEMGRERRRCKLYRYWFSTHSDGDLTSTQSYRQGRTFDDQGNSWKH